MKPDKLALILLITISLQMASCDQSVNQAESRDANDANVIARVENETITLEEVQKEMRYRGGHIPGRFASLESREALLNEIIHFEVLAQKAKAAGYENDPEIKAAVKKMMVKKFKQDYLEKLLHKQRVTNSEVQNYYQDHQDEFSTPEMFRAAIISVKFSPQDTGTVKSQKREKIRTARLKALRQKSKAGDFGKLARQYSDDVNTRYRGGAMNWLAKHAKIYRLDQNVVAAIFALKKKGEISPVIETAKGYYLVKLMDRQPAKPQAYKNVQNPIKQKLIAEKKQKWLEAYYQEAKDDYAITIHRQRLETMPTPGKFAKTNNTPPGFPIN